MPPIPTNSNQRYAPPQPLQQQQRNPQLPPNGNVNGASRGNLPNVQPNQMVPPANRAIAPMSDDNVPSLSQSGVQAQSLPQSVSQSQLQSQYGGNVGYGGEQFTSAQPEPSLLESFEPQQSQQYDDQFVSTNPGDYSMQSTVQLPYYKVNFPGLPNPTRPAGSLAAIQQYMHSVDPQFPEGESRDKYLGRYLIHYKHLETFDGKPPPVVQSLGDENNPFELGPGLRLRVHSINFAIEADAKHHNLHMKNKFDRWQNLMYDRMYVKAKPKPEPVPEGKAAAKPYQSYKWASTEQSTKQEAREDTFYKMNNLTPGASFVEEYSTDPAAKRPRQT